MWTALVNYCGQLTISSDREGKKGGWEKEALSSGDRFAWERSSLRVTTTRLSEKVSAGLIKSGLKLKGRNRKINGLLLVGRQIGTSRVEQGAKLNYFKAFKHTALACPCFQTKKHLKCSH